MILSGGGGGDAGRSRLGGGEERHVRGEVTEPVRRGREGQPLAGRELDDRPGRGAAALDVDGADGPDVAAGGRGEDRGRRRTVRIRPQARPWPVGAGSHRGPRPTYG